MIWKKNKAKKTEDSKEVSVKSYTKKIRKKNRKIDTSKIPVEIVNHAMPDEKCSCPECHARLVQVANPKIREEVKFVPAKLRLIEHHQAVYKCPECSSDDHSKISKAPMPRSLISHSKTGFPSIVAHIATFTHSDGRSFETAKKFLSDFNGYVQTDGYAGYNFLDRTRHLGCLAHVRRYFVDSLKNSSYKSSKSFSGEIFKDIDEVFEL